MRPQSRAHIQVPENFNTVRALVCLLVVGLHIIGMDERYGLQVPNDSWWHRLSTILALVRMPAFTILSGFMYGLSRSTQPLPGPFLTRKARRLLIPWLVATLVTWSVRSSVGVESMQLAHALTQRYHHLWFLQAIFVVFVIVSLVDAYVRPSIVWIAIATAVVTLASATLTDVLPTFWSLPDVAYLLPFFLFGVVLADPKGRTLLVSDLAAWVALAIAAVVFIIQFRMVLAGSALERDGVVAIAAGCASVLALLRYMPKVDALERIGLYSFTIYLWHAIFSPGTRMVVEKLGIASDGAVFLVSLGAGVALPIALHKFAENVPYLRAGLLGLNPVVRQRTAAVPVAV